jgi:hypothetical protein
MPDSPDSSPHLGLPYLLPSQAQKHVTHNEALRLLDTLVHLAVEDRDRAAPPAAPVPGQRHLVAPGATGAWSGREGQVAVWEDGAWSFLVPRPGWSLRVLAEGRTLLRGASAWDDGSGSPLAAASLGIGAAADAANRLAVASPATLLTHQGAGHQLKVNKAATADTASLLFQTAWAGRAEMGTAGSDRFALKVSADGAAWSEALSADPATGRLSLPAGADLGGPLGGTAVTQGPTDATPGRVIRTQDGILRGGVVGPVSQSGGLPTGALIETGANANGRFTRFADGTQMCWRRLVIKPASDSASGIKTVNWTFPAAFASAAEVAVNHIVQSTNPTQRGGTTVNAVTAAGADLLYHEGPGTAADVLTHATAIGRWF